MTSFAPPHVNLPVLCVFFFAVAHFPRIFRKLSANFPWNFFKIGEKHLAAELYEVTSNKINNSALLMQELQI